MFLFLIITSIKYFFGPWKFVGNIFPLPYNQSAIVARRL